MTYRTTRKRRDQLAAMRQAKEAKRLAQPAAVRPHELPDLRRRIVIEDFDFGHQVHIMELHRSDRVDCYRVVVDGKPWKERIGWSRILSCLRKSLPRVGAL